MSAEPVPTEGGAPTGGRWSVQAALAVFLAAGVSTVACFRQIVENDPGWHLALGRIFATQGLRFENALTWTAPHYRWYPTSWLYDWLSFIAYEHAGVAGLQGLTLALLLVTLAALVVLLRNVNPGTGLFLLPGLMLFLLPRTSVRPHVATWIVIAWTLACGRLGAAGSWRWRLAAIPVIALGSNLHSGAALGSGILGLYCIEAAWRERRWMREALLALGGGLAFLANPGGPSNLLSLRDHLHLNDVVMLTEYRPPTLETQPMFFPALLLVAAAAWFVRRRQPANGGAAVVMAYLAFAHGQRFVYEFYLVSAPLVAEAAGLLRQRAARQERAFLAVYTLVGLASCTDQLAHYPLGAQFDIAANAVRATRFIRDEGIVGRLFNDYHDGGYLAFMLPETPVYMDSRPYAFPPGFFDGELRAETSAVAFQRRMKAEDVEWAVTASYGRTLTGERLFDSPDWALVYWDDVNEIFLRRDVPRFAEKIARLEFKYFKRSVPPDIAIDQTVRRATPEGLAQYEAELARYEKYSPASFMEHYARCMVAVKKQDADQDRICAIGTTATP